VAAGERRVAITPDVASKLIKAGHEVLVESGAGEGAGHLDDAFQEAGAQIVDGQTARSAEFVALVTRPEPGSLGRTVAIGLLGPFDDPAAMQALAESGTTLFAFEAVPRTTRAQTVDALSSQATAAGYQAVLEGAARSDRFFPMLTTAAGTIRPSKVLVLGAGVAGLQAIATARRLGAVVSAFDVRTEAAEQVRSLGATFVELEVAAQDSSETGGYAREVAADEQARIVAGLRSQIAATDVVVATAAIPGRKAPLLVDRQAVEGMRPGSVVVDLAAATGGNCELTEPGSTIGHGGVTIVGDTDLVSRVANHASQMYARNVSAFLELVTGEDGSLVPNWDDAIVAQSCITRDGAVVHPRVLDALGAGGES
jgi:NAD(P) transhydrogenase subunit alpha